MVAYCCTDDLVGRGLFAKSANAASGAHVGQELIIMGEGFRQCGVHTGERAVKQVPPVLEKHVDADSRMAGGHAVFEGAPTAKLLESADIVQESAEPGEVRARLREARCASDAVAKVGDTIGVLRFERDARVLPVVGGEVRFEGRSRPLAIDGDRCLVAQAAGFIVCHIGYIPVSLSSSNHFHAEACTMRRPLFS